MTVLSRILAGLAVCVLVVGLLAVPGAFRSGRYVLNGGHYAVLNRIFEHPVLLVAGALVRPGGEESGDVHLDAAARPDHQFRGGDVHNCYEP